MKQKNPTKNHTEKHLKPPTVSSDKHAAPLK